MKIYFILLFYILYISSFAESLVITSVTPTTLGVDGGVITITGVGINLGVLVLNYGGVNLPNTAVSLLGDNALYNVSGVNQEILGATLSFNSILYSQFPINFRRFAVYSIEQKDFRVEVIGERFSLFPYLSISLGGVTNLASNVSIVNDTFVTFYINENNKNSNFQIISPLLKSVYSLSFINWNPLITTISNTTITPSSSITLSGLFFDEDPSTFKAGVVLQNHILNLTMDTSNISAVVVSDFPQNVGTLKLVVFNTITHLSNQIELIYPKPEIYSIDFTNNNKVAIKGNYFSQQPSLLDPSLIIPLLGGVFQSAYTFTSLDYTNIEFDLPLDSKSGNLTIEIANQVSTYPFRIKPNITSVSRIPNDGGNVTITGYFISPVSINNQHILSIKIGGFDCMDIKTIGTSFAPYTVQCIAPRGSGSKPLVIDSFGLSVSLTAYYVNSMVISSASSTVFNVSGIVTIFGDGFEDGVNVTIGNEPCTSPQVLSPKIITCQFPSTVVSGNKSLLRVNITNNGESAYSDVFMYKTQIGCLDCGSNGQCNSETGFCECSKGWTGMKCQYTVDSDSSAKIPKPTVDSITSTLDPGSKLDISISEIREVQPTGEIIKRYKTDQIQWNVNENTGDFYSYNGLYANDTNFKIQCNISVITNQTTHNFEGDIMVMSENSVKYVVKISGWQFKSNVNSLQLLFLSQANTDKCHDSIDMMSDSDQSIRFVEMYMGGDMMMKGYFSDRMVLDGRITKAMVSEIPANDVAYRELKTENQDLTYKLAAVSIAFHENYTIIDPNFGALLAESNYSRCSKKSLNWKITVIVVCSVVGGLSILYVVSVILKKKYHIQYKITASKLKRRGKSKFSRDRDRL